ncbi:MAG: DUF4367 domain-containing protein [Ruminococcus sp.]
MLHGIDLLLFIGGSAFGNACYLYILYPEGEKSRKVARAEEEFGMKAKKGKLADLNLDEELLREAAEIEEEIKNVPLEENPVDKERLRAKILMQVLQEEQKKQQKKNKRRRVQKWAAVIVLAFVGVFGVSMTSQANRIFLVQKVEEFFTGRTDVTVENGTIESANLDERRARDDIEQVLNVEVPEFYYVPEGMKFSGYEIYENVNTAEIYYSYNEKILTFYILGNNSDSAVSRSFDGKIVETFKTEVNGLEIELWEKENDVNNIIDCSAQWIYKNSYYSFSGIISLEEIKKILISMIY